MKLYFFLMLITLSSCSRTVQEQTTPETSLVRLIESTEIIRMLLCQNKLAQLLEEHDPEQLDLLINNYSPAQLALESELFSTTMPYAIAYFYKESPEDQLFLQQLEDIAQQYDDQVKIVTIDVDKLFSLAQDADIEQFPTMLILKEREIIDRIPGTITIKQVKDTIVHLLSNKS